MKKEPGADHGIHARVCELFDRAGRMEVAKLFGESVRGFIVQMLLF